MNILSLSSADSEESEDAEEQDFVEEEVIEESDSSDEEEEDESSRHHPGLDSNPSRWLEITPIWMLRTICFPAIQLCPLDPSLMATITSWTTTKRSLPARPNEPNPFDNTATKWNHLVLNNPFSNDHFLYHSEWFE